MQFPWIVFETNACRHQLRAPGDHKYFFDGGAPTASQNCVKYSPWTFDFEVIMEVGILRPRFWNDCRQPWPLRIGMHFCTPLWWKFRAKLKQQLFWDMFGRRACTRSINQFFEFWYRLGSARPTTRWEPYLPKNKFVPRVTPRYKSFLYNAVAICTSAHRLDFYNIKKEWGGGRCAAPGQWQQHCTGGPSC